MKTIHFFKTKSRIGLKNAPIYSDKLNIGVEDGPDAILTKSFLTILARRPLANVNEFKFIKPENIKNRNFNQVLSKSILDFKNFINLEISSSARNDKKTIQVVIGGDHSVTLPSILAAIERGVRNSFGIIYFDSHGDINLAKNSPTGNFHGMHMRPLFDKFDLPEIENLVPNKISTSNMLYIGNLDLDTEEEKFLTANKIRNITGNELKMNSAQILEEIKLFMDRIDQLYVSFDIDCMDKTEAPATGITAINGLHLMDLVPVLEVIKKHPDFSFDLVEVNPKKRGAKETILLAQKILSIVLS